MQILILLNVTENHEKVLNNLRTESESQKYVKADCATFPFNRFVDFEKYLKFA